jgi:hypothetical protein
VAFRTHVEGCVIERAAAMVSGNASPGAELQHRHTSDLLAELVSQVPDGPIDLDWLLGHLDRRSFGLILFIVGLLVVIPGVATVATIVLLFPAVEMMLGHSGPSFPAFLSKREFDFMRFRRFTARIRLALVAIESVTRPRWNAHRDATDRLIGGLVFVLALTAMWPLPLVNVIPGIVIALIAIAYLQEDGALLLASFVPAIAWISSFAWTIWTSAKAIMRWMT